METINRSSVADIMFQLRWRSASGRHTEMVHGGGVNLWRDLLPPAMVASLMGRGVGDQVEMDLSPGDAFRDRVPGMLFDVKNRQFDRNHVTGAVVHPRIGRFYPRGILRDVAGVFRENIIPFRLVGIDNGDLRVDFNHPLAGRPIHLTATVGHVARKGAERGGTSMDWLDRAGDGPGMQVRWNGTRTDFFADEPFRRSDEAPDSAFYRKPRRVDHIDTCAQGVIRDTYGRFLRAGHRVLDLMSGWRSHLPSNVAFAQVTGVGLNAEEMEGNPQLTDWVVQDVNKEPALPFAPGHFDAAVCTVSVEYMVHPLAVFREVERVLKPGGDFIVTFSNRWFPSKAINIWQQISEFERLGLVLDYFLESGRFTDLHTLTVRGLPRPATDKYYPQYRYADPVYAAWGKTKTTS